MLLSGQGPIDEPGNNKYQPAEFVPDYTVKAHTDITFIKIPAFLYKAAIRATRMQDEEGYDLEELGLVITVSFCTRFF